MRTTRRQFLKWSGMAAVGTVAFIGCDIRGEELLVESPSTMPEDLVSGLEAWYATLCAQCGAGEGVIVRVIGGRAIKIEGNPYHPVSGGKSFARCQAGLQALYNPDRLRGPLRRVGDRRSELTGISWEEALADLTKRLADASPGSVVLVTGPQRGTLGKVVQGFGSTYGAQHLVHEPMEQTVLRAAIKQVFGLDQLPVFDLARADYVLNFGADFLSTWLSPVFYNRAYGEFRQGDRPRGTLVQVEPRFSLTAANADRWLYIDPGKEGVLALSLAYVLLADHQGQINRRAAEDMTGGQGASYLEAFAPEKVAQELGVGWDAGKVRALAEEFAGHRRSLAIGGGPAGSHTNGLFNLKAIYSLNYLVGNVGREGGILFNPAPPLKDVPASAPGATLADWQRLVDRMRAGQVRLLLVHGSNPAYGLPAQLGFAAALEQVPQVVSCSSFMDETAALADLVLPDHVYLEAWGDDIPEPGPGYQTVTLQQPVVHPFKPGRDDPGTRAFGDVLLDVAKRLGGKAAEALPWKDMREAVRDTARQLHALGRGSVSAGDFEVFWNTLLQWGGWWDEKAVGPSVPGVPPRFDRDAVRPEFEGRPEEFPFYLVPFASHSLADGSGANLPWLQATPDPLTTAVWHTWAEVHPEDARRLGLKEGDELVVETPAGSVRRVLARPHPAAAPGVIAIPTGQGHTVYGDFPVGLGLKRYFSVVGRDRGANVFSILAPKRERETGALAWGATRVRIAKTGEWIRLSKFEGVVTPMFPKEVIPLARLSGEKRGS
ncbi:MAG: molybdopterin-dependent oxidoreductase [Chloroflexi bacterium]|nr:molybdopterin-dependent oxidoreductase [Chloroflexota bacterium]